MTPHRQTDFCAPLQGPFIGSPFLSTLCLLLWLFGRHIIKNASVPEMQLLLLLVRKRFSMCEITRFPAIVAQRLFPSAYPGFWDFRMTFCGTSSRNNGSSLWKTALRRHEPMQRRGHPLQADGGSPPFGGSCARVVYGNSCGLGSSTPLLDSSGRPQEPSRMRPPLQAAYLPKRKNVSIHTYRHSFPLRFKAAKGSRPALARLNHYLLPDTFAGTNRRAFTAPARILEETACFTIPSGIPHALPSARF